MPLRDGSFTLRVQQYDVTVTTKQVATTANGTTRTPAAIEASKTHENRHATNMQKIHDANQNKAIKTGLTEKQANSTREKEQTKLANEFKSSARQDQWNCKTGQGEWKPIIDQEKRKW